MTTIQRWFSGGLIGLLMMTRMCAFANEGAPGSRLRGLEQRAIMAQALAERVAELEAENTALKTDLGAARAELEAVRKDFQELEAARESLATQLAARDSDLAALERLLRMLRSGSFEYYEVQDGDTLERIAANPMVYGDAERSVWLRQANALAEDAELSPGMVLIVPRYAEGVGYEF